MYFWNMYRHQYLAINYANLISKALLQSGKSETHSYLLSYIKFEHPISFSEPTIGPEY